MAAVVLAVAVVVDNSGGSGSGSSSESDDAEGEDAVESSIERAVVVELASTKVEAMYCAIDVATALMAVDGVIVDTR